MQQEDDLRGLAKTMDFMRALSILFVVINIYWFCYGQIREWGINIGVVEVQQNPIDHADVDAPFPDGLVTEPINIDDYK